MEQNETQAEVRKEYPKPTYEQLEAKLGFISRKSNRRRAALKQSHDVILVMKYHHKALQNDYTHLVNQYNAAMEEIKELENDLEAKEDRPWYKFW